MKQNLNNLIKSLKLDYQNPDITEKNFPDTKRLLTDAKVFHFNRYISSEDVTKEIEKEGYVPANLRELLIWGSKNWNGNDSIVALGQDWRGPDGDRYVPFLSDWNGKRDLYLPCLGPGWRARCRFLAFLQVPKSLIPRNLVCQDKEHLEAVEMVGKMRKLLD